MDKKQFVEGINKLEMSYNQKFTIEKLKYWYEQLKEMDPSRYLKRINELTRVKQFMPNVAEILDKNCIATNYKQRDYSNTDLTFLYKNNKGEIGRAHV